MTHYAPVEAMAKLAELDADEIARLFVDLGIKGRRKQAESCPVAVFITSEADVEWANISTGTWLTPGVDRHPGKTPASVGEFVERFDRGRYPELEEKP